MDLFITGFLLSLSLCLDLGIVNLALIRTGITRGARASFMIGLGSCFGDLAYAIAAALGVASVMQFSAARWVLWIIGSLALTWLAIQMLRETLWPRSRITSAAPHAADVAVRSHFMTGLALALTSPSSMLWFVAVGGSLMGAATSGSASTGQSLLWFFVGFFTCGLVWSASLAWLASRSRQLGPTFIRTTAALSCALFAYFAVKVFLEGWRNLV